MEVCRKVYGFWIRLSIFLFYFIIQGEELISAAENGDNAAVERLLKENPSLISYKNSVRREESSYTTTSICIMSIYMLVLPPQHPFTQHVSTPSPGSLTDETHRYPLHPYIHCTHTLNIRMYVWKDMEGWFPVCTEVLYVHVPP